MKGFSGRRRKWRLVDVDVAVEFPDKWARLVNGQVIGVFAV